MNTESLFEISHDYTTQQDEHLPQESSRKSFRLFGKRSISKPVLLPNLKIQQSNDSNLHKINPLPPQDNKKSIFFNRGLSLDYAGQNGKQFEDPSMLLAKNLTEDTRVPIDFASNMLRKPDRSLIKNIKKLKVKNLDSLNSISQHNQTPNDSMNSEWQDRVMIPGVTEKFYKSGYLLKKPAFLKKWQMRYFEVVALKIYYARSKKDFEANLNVKCINLLTNPCTLARHKGKNFGFFVGGSNAVVLLRGNSEEEANEWVTFFEELFKFIRENYHTEKYIPSMETLNKPDVLFEEEFLSEAETGDILLFKTGSFKAKMQRMITISDYDHIALVLRGNDVVHIFEANADDGVQLLTWEQFKKTGTYINSPRIVYRKLVISDFLYKEELNEKLWEFATMHIGKKYELNMRKMLRKASVIKFADFQTPNPPKKKSIVLPSITPKLQHPQNQALFSSKSEVRLPLVVAYRDTQEGFFCSELIASAYKFVSLLDKTASSARYFPVSFSQKKELHLLNGATFSCEYGLAQIEGLEIYTSR